VLPPPPPPRWVVAPPPDPSSVEALRSELHLPGVLCSLLVARGFGEPARAKAFLRPMLSALHPPDRVKDLPRAVTRIESAIGDGETILIHGDYDVDGMAGTALLTRWLTRLGGKVVPFIPNRLTDGYDLGPAGLRMAAEAKASVILTVDCGIVAHEAVNEANAKGMDVIITDHHQPGKTLPGALAILDPAREDSAHPDPGLCGAGVAFKLCQGLGVARGVPEEELYPLLDLVGLATIADLVPLTGENRILARYGLKALAQTQNLGLRALMSEAAVVPADVSSGSVGFAIAPRLNAFGRLGHPDLGFRLLVTEDPDEARRLAHQAGTLNKQRQETDRRILKEALEQLARVYDPDEDFGVVLEGEGWHPGVIGIVASRVVERIHRPVVMVALDGDRARGSARSIPGFDLLGGIQACAEHLDRFGGHRQAAGMDIRRENLPAFRMAFNREAREILEGKELRPAVAPELEVELGEMSQELYRYLEYLGPHGMGNPRPVFRAGGLTLSGPARVVGSGHLKLSLRSGGEELEAIGFGMADRIPPSALGLGPVEVAFQLQDNEYRGVRRLQARLKDVRPGPGS
jgi:single-stranded-DNA-specific exonuclease